MQVSDEAVKDAAQNIRYALDNLNELVSNAAEFDIVVQYDVRRPRINEGGNPVIYAIISREI